MNNPFPPPDESDPKKTIVLNWINCMIHNDKGLRFHDCLDKVREFITNNDKDMALISAYYTINALNKYPKLGIVEKREITRYLKVEIDNMNDKT